MSRIEDVLLSRKQQGQKSLIVYLMAGCPNFATSLCAARAMISAGVDLIEIGIPFSDPMADGPVIQRAGTVALAAGASVQDSLHLVREIRSQSDIPLAVMTYANTVFHAGPERFVRQFKATGMDGLIVPDVPLEEAEAIEPVCTAANVDFIRFVAPTTTPARIAAICNDASGFLYCVSTTGVTGVRSGQRFDLLAPVIDAARRHTAIPLAMGFGIGSPQAAIAAAGLTDAVIVGSAVVQALLNDGVDAAADLVRSIRTALDEQG